MTIDILTSVLGGCSVINGALLLISSLYLHLAGDSAYRIQRSLFPVSREQFSMTAYRFLGLYKLLWIFFNVVPYVSLKWVAIS